MAMFRRVARGGLRDLFSPFTQKFFNLLEFLRKKTENHNPPPKFFHTISFDK